MGCSSSTSAVSVARQMGSKGDEDLSSSLPPPPPLSHLPPTHLLQFFPDNTLLSTLPLESRCALAEHLFSDSVGCLRSPFCDRYRLTRDGSSLATLYRSLRGYVSGPVLLVLRSWEDGGREFPILVGIYLSEPLVPRDAAVSGDGTTFAFTWSQAQGLVVLPTASPLDPGFPSTSFASHCFAVCSESSCSFGLSEEFGTCLLRIDSDLEWASGGASDTFRNAGCVFPGIVATQAGEGRMRLDEVELLCKTAVCV